MRLLTYSECWRFRGVSMACWELELFGLSGYRSDLSFALVERPVAHRLSN
jgi:hypothetical protein